MGKGKNERQDFCIGLDTVHRESQFKNQYLNYCVCQDEFGGKGQDENQCWSEDGNEGEVQGHTHCPWQGPGWGHD